MKRMFIAFLSCLVLTTTVLAQSSKDPLAGNWLATLDLNGQKLRLGLRVENNGTKYTAKLDSIDQGTSNLPVETITLSDRKVSFTAPQLAMSYEGTINDQNDEITGTLKLGPNSRPFVFKRVNEIPSSARKQDPKKPYPYDEVEVSYRNTIDNVKLAGTLTLPRNDNPKHPVVLLISGSGAQNRDSLIAGHRPFLVLADHLTRNGIAVLRVDDRGTGQSELGSLNVTSENFVQDVLAGVEYLKTRKEIDARRIGLIGHSEGGMIAPMAAVQSRDIAFIVLLAGMGQTGYDVIQTQNRLILTASGAGEETIAAAVELSKSINAVVRDESDDKRIESGVNEAIAKFTASKTEEQLKALAPMISNAKAQMPIYKMPWYRYFVRFDPATVLKKVTIPVLALNGELDLQVAYKENLELIAASLKAGGNKDVTVKSFPKLNHLFQTSKTGLLAEYMTLEETMSPQVLDTITEWIRTRAERAN